ncbi:hypothetical protein BCR34DRAFT_476234 [Clohesyomyces aquaticus]|uniref:Zn(2)-C6 fungal-type domain-containing protein n=1 Tax=Clohesyomyces aquaticus TaxID=1231657 RepID=A0A1Y2A1N1_9PLEO|nr:hypothetical protein BCR34DRAFT_476234 [Clohesyomyces aquaticus]
MTCRKRKKKCDLRKPKCLNCEEKGLVCGGYGREAVFINQYSTVSEPSVTRPKTPPNPFTVDPGAIVLPESLARSAYGEKSIGMFWDLYLPNDAISGHEASSLPTGKWSTIVTDLYVQDDALRVALLALSSAAVGRQHSDSWMVNQGRKLYGQGLAEMGKTLRDPRSASNEALLAAPQIMGLFEILFGTDTGLGVQARSWRSHAEGQLAMMTAIGPSAWKIGVAHELFLDSRMSAIIAGVRMRKATLLDKEEWRTVPWQLVPKTPMDSLLDIFAGVPAIMQCVESLRSAGVDGTRRETLAYCWTLESQIAIWLDDHRGRIYAPETDAPVPIDFPNLPTAHLTVIYWTTRMLLQLALLLLLSSPPGSPPRASPFLPSASPLSSSFNKDPRVYARRIARSVPYFFNSSSGIFGATMIAFPIGVTFMCYDQTGGGDDEYRKFIFVTFKRPGLPSSIQLFLKSMCEPGAQS